MKNVYYNCLVRYLCILFVCVLLSACTSEENENVNNTLKILQSEVSFNSHGGQGKISVESDYTISAVSNSSWCNVTMDGNSTVKLIVEKNPSKEYRIATITIRDTSGNSCHVAVTQSGNIFNIQGERTVFFTNKADSHSFPIYFEDNITIKCEDDWLHAEVKSNSLVINVTGNTSTRIRKSYIYLSSEVTRDTLTIFQGDFDNLHGRYKLHAYRAIEPGLGLEYIFNCEIVQEDNVYLIKPENQTWFIPIIPVQGKLKGYIPNAEYAGKGKSSGRDYSLFICQYAPYVSGGYAIHAYGGPSLTLNFDIVDGKIVGKIEDNGSWPNGVTTNTIYLIACLPASITNFADRTSIGGFYQGMYDITLEKIEE